MAPLLRQHPGRSLRLPTPCCSTHPLLYDTIWSEAVSIFTLVWVYPNLRVRVHAHVLKCLHLCCVLHLCPTHVLTCVCVSPETPTVKDDRVMFLPTLHVFHYDNNCSVTASDYI
jgi:hypothetical protein